MPSFFIVHDGGIVTKPVVAADLTAAAEGIREAVGGGVGDDRTAPITVGLLIPTAVATVTPNPANPSAATIDATFTTAAANRATLVTKAQTALIRLALGLLDTTAGT